MVIAACVAARHENKALQLEGLNTFTMQSGLRDHTLSTAATGA